jgi:hypothetical protein
MLSESAAAFLLLAGLAVLVAGLALWSSVAGLVAAGLALCLLSILWNRGAEK